MNAGKAEVLVTAVRARCSGQNLSLADRGGRFHINDDRVVDIDQIVGGVSEESLPAKSSSPATDRPR
jgi:hypothetical protein